MTAPRGRRRPVAEAARGVGLFLVLAATVVVAAVAIAALTTFLLT